MLPATSLLLLALSFPAPTATATATTTAPLAANATALAPVDVHRRAIDFLEEQRDRDGSQWVDARLDDTPVPLHVPGLDAPTHFEFKVVGPDGEPRGYMVLSTSRSDFPVAHAAQAGLPPSATLATSATGPIERIYRFGHRSYVAENSDGQQVAQLGAWPAALTGLPDDAVTIDDAQRQGWFRSLPGQADDEHHPTVADSMTWAPWPSWEALRRGYRDQYEQLEPIARRNAAEDWAVEDLRRDSGETLQSGEFRERPLLRRGSASWTVTGQGREHVVVELGERTFEGDTVLRVFVESGPVGRVLPVDIDVRYGDGTQETLRLNVTHRIPQHVLGAPLPPTATTTATTTMAAMAMAADPPTHRAWQLPKCSKAVVKTGYDNYLRGHSGSTAIDAAGAYRDERAMFSIENGKVSGSIALRGPNGRYLHAPHRENASLVANATTVGRDESFYLYTREDRPGFYGMGTAKGREVSFRGDGGVKSGKYGLPYPFVQFEYCQPRNTYARWAGTSFADAWAKVRRYDQVPAHRAPSTSQCASGCAATAWAMLFGFHDYEASIGDPRWSHLKGLYRAANAETGDPEAVAPARLFVGVGNQLSSAWKRESYSMHSGAAGMIWEISQDINDWALAGCAPNGAKWTVPGIMGKAKRYLNRRVDVGLVHDYDGLFIMTPAGKKNAYAVIKDHKPVVLGIGAGDSLHYPLGIGRDNTDYRIWDRARQQWAPEANHRHFIVHMGHQQAHADIVPYGTWFAGHVLPTPPTSKSESKPTSKPKSEPKSKSKSKTKSSKRYRPGVRRTRR